MFALLMSYIPPAVTEQPVFTRCGGIGCADRYRSGGGGILGKRPVGAPDSDSGEVEHELYDAQNYHHKQQGKGHAKGDEMAGFAL